MYVTLVVHHPRGPNEKAVMMSWMPKIAEEEAKHKGFIHFVIGEVEDENIIVPLALWETEENYKAAMPEIRKFLMTHDFSIQEGPTRQGGSTISKEAKITTFKIRPVVPPSSGGQPPSTT